VPLPVGIGDDTGDDREKVEETSTTPTAVAESRTAVAMPRLSRPIRVR
jgi:hypothetical protein